MKFEEALKAMRKGKAVKRQFYETDFILKDNQILYRYKNLGGYFFGLVMIETKDLLAEDWEIVDE